MRIAALFLGLIGGLFALLAPSAFRTDLISPFLELWAANPSEHLLGTITWYAIPAAALLGGLLATVTPGFAALLLFGAACGWVGIGLMLPTLFDLQLIAPAAAAGLGSVLAFLAGELEVRQRRMRRRNRRVATGTLLNEDGEIEREAALRMDPLVVPRDDLPPPRRAIPLTLDDVSVTSHPSKPPPRWQDLDAPAEKRRGADMWAEAIRSEPEPEARPAPKRIGAEPRAEFKWDEDDAPAEQRREAVSPPGLRLEPRRPEPAAHPAAPRDATEPWPEPHPRRPVVVTRETPRRGSRFVAAMAAVVAVLGLGVLGAGGYVAYREGWVDQLIAIAWPTASPAPQAASTPEPVKAAVPAQPASSAPPAVVQPVATTGAATKQIFDDPFAYCRAVGTIDYLDSRYAGPATVEAITRALSLPATASRDRVHWRCVRGAVLACTSYAGPICDMAPTVEEMRAFCDRNPKAQQLMAPSGTWACVDGRPQLPEGAQWPVDERGFLPMSWIEVRPDATPAG